MQMQKFALMTLYSIVCDSVNSCNVTLISQMSGLNKIHKELYLAIDIRAVETQSTSATSEYHMHTLSWTVLSLNATHLTILVLTLFRNLRRIMENV